MAASPANNQNMMDRGSETQTSWTTPIMASPIAAPTIPFGYADYFRGVAGGVQLRAATFAMLLEDICRNFIDHGLEHLVIFNGHTGNAPVISVNPSLIATAPRPSGTSPIASYSINSAIVKQSCVSTKCRSASETSAA